MNSARDIRLLVTKVGIKLPAVELKALLDKYVIYQYIPAKDVP